VDTVETCSIRSIKREYSAFGVSGHGISCAVWGVLVVVQT